MKPKKMQHTTCIGVVQARAAVSNWKSAMITMQAVKGEESRVPKFYQGNIV
jgi:hypothetical protein